MEYIAGSQAKASLVQPSRGNQKSLWRGPGQSRKEDVTNKEGGLTGKLSAGQLWSQLPAGHPLAMPVLNPPSPERRSFSNLGEGQEFLVVALGDVHHQLLRALGQLPGEEPWRGKEREQLAGPPAPPNTLPLPAYLGSQRRR